MSEPLNATNPVTFDALTLPGEAGANELWLFTALAGGGTQSSIFSGEAPPPGMFANGNDGGASSMNAAAFAGANSAFFYPQDVYGDHFAFRDAFSVELFFRTDGERSGAGRMQLVNQGEGSFRYGLIVNEPGGGNVRFAVNDGQGMIAAVDLVDRNYADGLWHYVLATYDPDAGAGGELSLAALNVDGTTEERVAALPGGFAGLPGGNDWNMLIGRQDFDAGSGERTFLGLIDEVQLSCGIVPDDRLLGAIRAPTPACAGDVNGDGVTDVFDFSDLAANFGAGPGATREQGDLTGDGFVDVFDFGELAADFGCGSG
jgi:hypothetical protein